MRSKIKALCVTFIFSFGTTWAADSQISAKKSKSWSLSAEASLGTSMHHFDDPDKAISTDFSLSPTYKVGKGITLFGSVSGNKDLKGERLWTWGNSALGLSSSLGKTEYISTSGSLIATLPTSEAAKDYQKMIAGLTVAPKFSLRTNKLGFENFGISYAPSATVYFHEYTTSLTGGSNKQYLLSNSLSLSYTITDEVSLFGVGKYGRSITYKGNQSDFYSFVAGASYAPTANTSLTAGVAQGGSPLAANGYETDIDLYDARAASMFFSFGFAY
jgi:hypothetical protein